MPLRPPKVYHDNLCKVVLDFLQISYPCIFPVLENIDLSFYSKSFNSSKYIFRNFSSLKTKVVSPARHSWEQPEWGHCPLNGEEEDGGGKDCGRECVLGSGRGKPKWKRSHGHPGVLKWATAFGRIGSGWAEKYWVQIGHWCHVNP